LPVRRGGKRRGNPKKTRQFYKGGIKNVPKSRTKKLSRGYKGRHARRGPQSIVRRNVANVEG